MRIATGMAVGMAALAAVLAAASAEAKTYALVIGIDEYAHVPPLAGAAPR